MTRPINPYNVFPFYDENNSRAKEGYLFSPTENLPPFQIPINASGVSVSGFYIQDLDGFTETSIPTGNIDKDCTNDLYTYLTYKGGAITGLSEGMYQLRVETSQGTYWSHALCLSEKFDDLDASLDTPVCTPLSGYDFSIQFTTSPAPGTRMIEIWQTADTSWTWKGTNSATIDDQEVKGGPGVVTIKVRGTVFFGDLCIWKIYELTFDTTDACNTDTWTLVETGGENLDRGAYLEFFHDTDLQQPNIFYQDGYKQRFYLDAEYGFDTPVLEDNFLRNGRNVQILQSANTARQINVESYPVPDAAFHALALARVHDNINYVRTVDNKTQAVTNFNFASRAVENDELSVGQLTFEVDRQFVPSCDEDKTAVAC